MYRSEYNISGRHGQRGWRRVHCSAMELRETTNSPACESAGQVMAGKASPMTFMRAARSGVTGLLMGIANLIPGVSGGTMILAMGLYEEFIDSVAELTALRFSWRRIFFLGMVGGFAAVAIIGLAGVILYLLFHYTVVMFSLFIGLTLGGAPLLFKSLRPVRADVVAAVVVGFVLMVGVFFLKGGSGFSAQSGYGFRIGCDWFDDDGVAGDLRLVHVVGDGPIRSGGWGGA